jgi:predicted Zn-dependent protease
MRPMHRFILQIMLLGLGLIPGQSFGHGSLHETVRALEVELAEKPGDPDLLLRLAGLHCKHGDLDKAKACADQVKPEQRAAVHLINARLHEAAGKPAAALVATESFIALKPDEPEGWYQNAGLLTRTQQPDKAAHAHAQGLTLSGESASADMFLYGAKLWQDCDNQEKALETLSKGAAQHPKHPILAESLGRMLFSEGDQEASLVIFDKQRTIYPTMAYRWWKLEGDLYAPSNPERSRMAYRKALAHLDQRYAKRRPPAAVEEIRKQIESIMQRAERAGQ